MQVYRGPKRLTIRGRQLTVSSEGADTSIGRVQLIRVAERSSVARVLQSPLYMS